MPSRICALEIKTSAGFRFGSEGERTRLLDGNGWSPRLLLIQDGEAHGTGRVAVKEARELRTPLGDFIMRPRTCSGGRSCERRNPRQYGRKLAVKRGTYLAGNLPVERRNEESVQASSKEQEAESATDTWEALKGSLSGSRCSGQLRARSC